MLFNKQHMTEIEFGKEIEEKLALLIEKYGKREVPLENSESDTKSETKSDDEEDEYDENDELEEKLVNEFRKKVMKNIKNNKKEYNKSEYYFHYETEKEKSPFTSKTRYYYSVVVNDEDMKKTLSDITTDIFSTGDDIELEYLFYYINDIRINAKKDKYVNNPHVHRIKNFIEELFDDRYKIIDEMIAQNKINFKSLWYYLDKTETYYIIKTLEEEICYRHKQFGYRKDLTSEFLMLSGDIIKYHDGKLYLSMIEYKIDEFKGLKDFESLKIYPVKNEQKEQLINYGDAILNMYDKITCMNLSGRHLFKKGNDLMKYNRHERVIVDYEGFHKYSTDFFATSVEKLFDMAHLNDDNKMIISPFVPIYNLGISKVWGLTHIKYLSPVTFDKTVFDYLVLDEKKKYMIKCLIDRNRNSRYKDFIETKGNGLIFLLYGPPGVGKTLTAEATSEYLEKPLYSISVGDLGTNPEVMEDIMNEILDYIKRWNAIILIDEVDVFLEERETNMIVRNAMVGVFLKLLEYHDGIMFLTTNRLTNIDCAVKSRINLMLSYKELDEQNRRLIWISLLKKWNINLKPTTLTKLQTYKLNGREIRNYMKIVFSIHDHENKEITDDSLIKELELCFKMTEEFITSLHETRMYT